MDTHYTLEKRRALITGGGSGIGLAIATEMAQAGAQVVICGRRREPLEKAARDIGGGATYLVQDLTELKQLPDFIAQIERECGPIDILVNNAGVNMKRSMLDTSDDQFSEILQTDLNAVFSLTREVTRHMLQRENGTILMILSMASLFGIPQVSAYTAAKAALAGLVRELATELSPHGITVNGIAPGWFDTAMSRKAFADDPQRLEKVLSRTPAGRLGRTEEVAYASVFLSSDAARFITGAILPVDGGASIGF